MSRPASLRLPPRQTNYEGARRRVGVELEFAAVSARAGAERVQALFGGTIEEEDPHRYHVKQTELGDFCCELDTRYAHRPADGAETDLGPGVEEGLAPALNKFDARIRALVGDISAVVVPCEIVCPPVPIDKLRCLESLVENLTDAGAEGTRANPLYAFGAQLNPDIADRQGEWILSVFKAYLLLSDWLRAVMSIDPTRRLFAFADRFAAGYVAMVVDPAYWPSLERMIDDYLEANPTRNRELDMLPLFAWLDEPRVRSVVPDPRVKARPTFHYRLPDANFGEPDWGITAEWNRWCLVECLADEREKLDAMGKAYRANRDKWIPESWAIQASEWLLLR